uniref:Putative secreted protein n=1 Tax=Anopheles triannulatus TaxID=58253 RepID=A0A2M4B672_9DIPT
MRKQATSVSMTTSMANGSVILAFALPHIFCDSTSAMVSGGPGWAGHGQLIPVTDGRNNTGHCATRYALITEKRRTQIRTILIWRTDTTTCCECGFAPQFHVPDRHTY